MQYKYNKLRGRIIEKFGTQEKFAKALGISKQALSKKMTGKTGISQADIVRWCRMLDIQTNALSEYFFA